MGILKPEKLMNKKGRIYDNERAAIPKVALRGRRGDDVVVNLFSEDADPLSPHHLLVISYNLSKKTGVITGRRLGRDCVDWLLPREIDVDKYNHHSAMENGVVITHPLSEIKLALKRVFKNITWMIKS